MTKEIKKMAIAFLIGTALLFFAISQQEKSEPVKTAQNVAPPEFVEIQGEKIKLSDVQGYQIIQYSVARKTYQENIYILRLYGIAHEFDFNTHGEAQDIGDYICMLKGERL